MNAKVSNVSLFCVSLSPLYVCTCVCACCVWVCAITKWAHEHEAFLQQRCALRGIHVMPTHQWLCCSVCVAVCCSECATHSGVLQLRCCSECVAVHHFDACASMLHNNGYALTFSKKQVNLCYEKQIFSTLVFPCIFFLLLLQVTLPQTARHNCAQHFVCCAL